MTIDLNDFLEAVEKRYGREAADTCRAVQFTAAEMLIHDEAPASPTASYLGGYPYVPADVEWAWPVGEESGELMTFLGQVNFSEVEGLEGYPTAGLLQWFIDGANDTFGLTWEAGSTRQEGLRVFWYAGDLAPSLRQPTDLLPYTEAHDEDPFDIDPGDDMMRRHRPHRVSFSTRAFLPTPYGENNEESEALKAYEEIAEDLDVFAHDELKTAPPFAPGFAVGGQPVLIQGDPRPAPYGEDDCLLINLDSADGLFMWGDVGTAQLFGNPRKLAAGDASTLYWDWACS